MQKKIALIFLIIIIFILSAPSTLAWSFSDIPGFYGKTASEAGLTQKDTAAIVAKAITITLSVVGAIFVILFIYGGIVWMTSAGSEDKVGKAKKTLVYATVGMGVIAAAYAITTFVVLAIPTGDVTTTINPAVPGGTPDTATCVGQGGVCATADYCTRILQGTLLGVTKDCGDQTCCKKPAVTQKCSDCGKGSSQHCITNAITGTLYCVPNACDGPECASLGKNCEWHPLTRYCEYNPDWSDK